MNPPGRGAVSSSAPLWAALAACSLLLFWIANGVVIFEGDSHDAWHHYEYLVDGFLKGHTSLSVEPSPELLRLADPHDPVQNGPWRLWDASLFNGKFYLYFGPTPVLLMLPWKLALGHHLPQRLAAAAFGGIGLCAIALLIAGVRRRHFPRLTPIAAGGILVVATCASWLPVTLRRPDVWELPIAAACACLWWSLYFLWRCLDSEEGGRWALAAGAAVVLMLGSRPTMFFAGATIIALMFDFRRPSDRRPMLAAAVAAAGGLVLLAYNYERFGRLFEFGQSYQLWGTDERNVVHFSLRYFRYNAWVYLFGIPDVSPYFPFLLAVPPGGEPAGHLGIDEVHGALIAIPIQLAGLAALAWAWSRRRDPETAALRKTIVAAVISSGIAAFILFCFAGAVTRYTTEMFAGATVAMAIGLMAIFGGSLGGPARNVVRLLAVCASVWTVAYVGLASAEQRILFKKTNPASYAFFAHILDYPSLWVSQGEGAVFGPVGLSIKVPSEGVPATVLLSSGRQGMMNQLILERTGPGRARLVMTENFLTLVLASQDFATKGGEVRAQIDAPWLYPPPQHPWWDRIANPDLKCDLQTRFGIFVDGRQSQAHTVHFFDSTRFEPYVAKRGTVGAGDAWVDSLNPLPVPGR
jgi:hypothetical protein